MKDIIFNGEAVSLIGLREEIEEAKKLKKYFTDKVFSAFVVEALLDELEKHTQRIKVETPATGTVVENQMGSYSPYEEAVFFGADSGVFYDDEPVGVVRNGVYLGTFKIKLLNAPSVRKTGTILLEGFDFEKGDIITQRIQHDGA